MKSEKFSKALGEIDVKYVEEVINYKPASKKKLIVFRVAAACIAVIFIFAGIIPLVMKEDKDSTFTITAYASQNSIVITNTVTEESRVPISLFETENGLKGFVFSYDKNDPGEVSSVSIMTEGEIPGVIDEIVGLQMGTDQHYIIYVPEQSKTAPYHFMIPHTDTEAKMVWFCYLMVEETEDGYTAVIEKMEGFEQKMRPD